MLHIDGLLLRNAADFARLLEILACAELTDGTGLFELTLELFQSALNILTIFYWYDNHALNHPLFSFEVAKIAIFSV